MDANENLEDPNRSKANSGGTPAWLPVVVAVVTGGAVLAGGFACGWAIQKFSTLGAVSLALLGWLAGLAARKVLGTNSRLVAWTLVGTCLLAAVPAEVYWIRFSTVQGEAGWLASLGQLPVFVQEYTVAAAAAIIAAGCGAYFAFTQTAYRYRMVAVRED